MTKNSFKLNTNGSFCCPTRQDRLILEAGGGANDLGNEEVHIHKYFINTTILTPFALL